MTGLRGPEAHARAISLNRYKLIFIMVIFMVAIIYMRFLEAYFRVTEVYKIVY